MPVHHADRAGAAVVDAGVTVCAPADLSSVGNNDFRRLADHLPHIVWIISGDGATEYLNAHGAQYLGSAPGIGTEADLASLIHPEDSRGAGQAWTCATRTRTLFVLACRLRRFDGTYRWHAVRANPVCDSLGSVVRWIGTATDIDDAKAVEVEVRRAERTAAETVALLETLQSKAPIGFGFVDRDYRRVMANETLAACNGSTVEEQLGRRMPDLVPLVWPQMEPLYRRVLDDGESVLDVEVVGPSAKDPLGTHHWLVSYYPVEVGEETIGIGVVAVDVTQRRELDRAQRQMSAIVENSGDAIFGSTPEGLVTTMNGAAERLFGYNGMEMIGKPLALLAPGTLTVQMQQTRARLIAGGPPERYDTRRRCKDATMVDVHVIASPVRDEAGAVVGLSVIMEDITERIESQRELEASQRRLAESQRIAEIGSFEVDLLSDTVTWSAELYRLLGIDPAVKPGVHRLISMIHPEDRATVAQAWGDAAAKGMGFDLTYRLIRDDGRQLWVAGRTVPEIGASGRVIRLSGTVRDNTERVGAARAQVAADSRFEAGFEQGGIGTGILDLQGRPSRVNAAVCALLGRDEQELIGRSWAEFSHPEDVPLSTAMSARLAGGHDTYSDERRYLRPDGSTAWVAMHLTLVRDEFGKPDYYLGQLQDIGERKQMEADLVHQALHDSLTGLANKALLTDRLTHSLNAARMRVSKLAVVFLDIDNFKVVNDTLGHTAGDDLLKDAGARIAAAVRSNDTLARFGGDEFVVICEGASVDEAEQVGERIRAAFDKPFHIAGNELHITVSMGIALADAQATAESLLGDADAAMYVAKRLGRDRIEKFDNALRAKAEGRMATASALRHALDGRQFVVHYQPVVDLGTGSMVSAEALLRWDHPHRGLVSPAEFIPLAEETGLIIPIGAWVLEHACEQLVEWQRTVPHMSIAVNLSVRQMRAPDVTEVIAGILARTGVPPASVCLELTESVFMEDADYFGTTLAKIKALGVMLAIDDFGTGYSSLSYLKKFPVDAVKIDRAFVDGLGTNPHDSALVAAILAMAEALELGVTAEGIETRQQLMMLKDLNCHRAQGFYLGRPGPAAAIDQLVSQAHQWQVD